MKINFIDVGRNNKCWTLEAEPMTEYHILKSIQKSGALMSKNIGFDLDLETGKGEVYAGFRVVGKIEIERKENPK